MESVNNKSFKPNYWGRLPQFEVPHSIVQDDVLTLKPDALAILLVLFEVCAAKRATAIGSSVEVKITQDLLMKRSGFSKDKITAGVKALAVKKFILSDSSRKKHGEFGSNVYTLCNPATGMALEAKGRNILYSNNVQYIKIPKCVVKNHEAEWSIANMTSSELRMYISICWFANRKNRSVFNVTNGELKKLAGFSTAGTAQTALDGLVDKNLVSFLCDEMVLHDPYTGEPLHVEDGDPYADPANYYIVREQGRATRWNLNNGDPKQVEQLLRDCGLDPVQQNDGEFAVLCPFHPDNKPSCLVNPKKRVFYCHGCAARGILTQLVMQIHGMNKGEALKFMAGSTGQSIDFHQPDKNAEAIYSYRDVNHNLVKQILRYPGKDFRQRRPVRGGWIWNLDGVQPRLYNLDRLKYANVICFCEGEKDCDTIMGLNLYDTSGEQVIATTSGNAESWRDQLANDLKGKRVILMPDADEPGDRYRAEVQASLTARGIDYRVVGFGDSGAKDVSDFIASGGTKEQIVKRTGKDWVRTAVPSPMELDDDYDPSRVTI